MAAPPDVTLLVDGYNVIGAWMPMAFSGDRAVLESARSQLIEELANYSAFQGYQTRIIFDAHQRHESYGSSEIITNALEICYTEFGETADSHIEIFCAQARFKARTAHHRLIVATNDRAQQLTVSGYGAQWISAQQLMGDVEAIALSIQRKQRSNKKSSTRLLSHSLDPDAKKKLEKWRHGLN
jgi:uncharacterized protein